MSSSSVSKCPVLDQTARAMHAEAATFRAEGPAVLVEFPGAVRAWCVTRHNVIRALTDDPRVSRDARRHWPGLADVPDGWPLAPIVLQQSFINAYGDEHRRVRRRIAPSFSAASRAAASAGPGDRGPLGRGAGRPAARDDDRRAAGPVAADGHHRDCDLFGVPGHRREKLGAAIHAVLDPAVDPERALAIQTELHNRLTELLQYKREHPAPA